MSDSASIYFPVDWPLIPISHSTLIFLGKTRHIEVEREKLVFIVEQLLPQFPAYIVAHVMGTSYFGPQKNKPVVIIKNPLLQAYRTIVEEKLIVNNIDWPATWGFNPHVSCARDDLKDVPSAIFLGRPRLKWGNEPGEKYYDL